MKITAYASPNHGARPAGTLIDCVVLHADESNHAQASVDWIRSSASKVSYHAMADRDGHVYRFVETNRRAFHAGVSEFRGRRNLNDFSLGFALANKNDGLEAYPIEQLQAGAEYVASWMMNFPLITLDRITTHALVALPLGRKTDPLGLDLEHFRDMVSVALEVARAT